MEHAHMKPAIGRKRNDSHSKAVIQMHLETTVPGDAWEQEADRAADMVTGTRGAKVSTGGAPAISAYGGTPVTISSRMESQFNALQGGGMSMPDSLRAQMQHGFGRDFSDVRLHTGREAAEMNSSLGSRAFTHGNDIYFNEGQYQPHTTEGRHLIAHELAHTIQQSGKVARSPQEGAAKGLVDLDFLLTNEEAIGLVSTVLGTMGVIDELFKETSYFRTVANFEAYESVWSGVAKGLRGCFDKSRSAAELKNTYKSSTPSKYDVISYLWQITDWILKLCNAIKIVNNQGGEDPSCNINLGYTILRLVTCIVDSPFNIPIPISAMAVIRAWNVGSSIGDLIYTTEDKLGYYDKFVLPRQRRAAKRFGGTGTRFGNTAAFFAGMPVVGFVGDIASYLGEKMGDVAHYKTEMDKKKTNAVGDIIGSTVSDIGNSIENFAYDAYKDAMYAIMPF